MIPTRDVRIATQDEKPILARDLLVRLIGSGKGACVSVEQAAALLGISRPAAAMRLTRLARQGWLTKVRRGVYLPNGFEQAPREAPPQDREQPDLDLLEPSHNPFAIARDLFEPCYIGGWSAAEYWGLLFPCLLLDPPSTEGRAAAELRLRSTFVVSAGARRRRRELTRLGEFFVIRVARARVEQVSKVWCAGVELRVSSPERTLADVLMHPDWVGGIRAVVEMMRAYDEWENRRPREIARHIELLEAGAAWKRLGFLAERLWPKQRELIRRALDARSKGTSRLDPALPDCGKVDSRWRLRINARID